MLSKLLITLFVITSLVGAMGIPAFADDLPSPDREASVIFYMKSTTKAHSFDPSDLQFLHQMKDALSGVDFKIYWQANDEAKLSSVFANLFRSWPWIDVPLLMKHKRLIWKPFPHSVFNPVLDAIVHVDFSTLPDSSQLAIVEQIKHHFLDSGRWRLSVSATQRYVALNKGTSRDTDYKVAFLVPWKPGMDQRVSEDIWIGHHRKLALSLLPPQLETYVIYRTNLNYDSQGIFDEYYQGICYEDVPSAALIRSLAKEKGAWKASFTLAADETSFIGHPSFLVLKPVSF